MLKAVLLCGAFLFLARGAQRQSVVWDEKLARPMLRPLSAGRHRLLVEGVSKKLVPKPGPVNGSFEQFKPSSPSHGSKPRLTVFVSTDVSGPTLPTSMMWATRPGLIKKSLALKPMGGVFQDVGIEKFCADVTWGPRKLNRRCDSQPNNTLVKTVRWGYCEGMTHKECSYFTLLQDPVTNTIESYNTYCLSCGHQRLYCGKNRSQTGCPNINITEWARRRDNILTRSFATTGYTTSEGSKHSSSSRDFKLRREPFNPGSSFVEPLIEEDYRRALRHLRRSNVVPICTEEMHIGQRGRASGSSLLDGLLGRLPFSELPNDPQRQTLMHKLNASLQKLEAKKTLIYLPTLQEAEEIRRIMKWDILIYKALFGRSDEVR